MRFQSCDLSHKRFEVAARSLFITQANTDSAVAQFLLKIALDENE